MTVYVLELGALCEKDVDALFDTLPPFRKKEAVRYRHREGFTQSVVGFCLVRYALKQLDQKVNADAWSIAENGKPYLATGAPFFNLTHTAHCVAVAVSKRCEVGIDIEQIKPRSTGFTKRFYSAQEQSAIQASPDPTSEAIRLWSAKEAEAKRSGKGIARDTREIPLETVQSVPVTVGGVPHWLSVSPAKETPQIVWVDNKELFSKKS